MSATIEQILAIHGNDKVYEDLCSSLRERKCSAFLGAGASAGLYPLWDELIDRMLDQACANGASKEDLQKLFNEGGLNAQQRLKVLKEKMREQPYYSFLRETFKQRKGPDGKTYTQIHKALIDLPFKGYITTNFDPGLSFARNTRSSVETTGTPTWKDESEVLRWMNGDIFEDDCPILWIHGYWQREDTMLLTSDEYRSAYSPTIYELMFQTLWLRETLVFVGYGFKDEVIANTVGDLLYKIRNAHPETRHFAVVGLPIEDCNRQSHVYLDLIRDRWRSDYSAHCLFYPILRAIGPDQPLSDHSALRLLLDTIRLECGMQSLQGPPLVAPPTAIAREQIQISWEHGALDDKFTGREEEIGKLDRWMRDDKVKVIGISAIGGTGKTTLAEYWLKKTTGWHSTAIGGIFYWSYGENKNSVNFLEAFLTWAQSLSSILPPQDKDEKDLLDKVIRILEAQPLIIVLDGLEVLQGELNEMESGRFLDDILRSLLGEASTAERPFRSRIVLTSRFLFKDLETRIGTTFHQLELEGLGDEQGGALLSSLGMKGQADDLRNISRLLDGHPLALRLFARLLLDDPEGRAESEQPLRYLSRLLSGAASEPLNAKIVSILQFYERQLPRLHTKVLNIISLFPGVVEEGTIVALADTLFPPEDDLQSVRQEIRRALQQLYSQMIISRHSSQNGGVGYMCHAILRDYFRRILLKDTDVAHKAVDLIKPKSRSTIIDLDDAEKYFIAIRILLDIGDLTGAEGLYTASLPSFQRIRDLKIGDQVFECEMGFIGDKERTERCIRLLGRYDTAKHFHVASAFSKAQLLALEYNNQSFQLLQGYNVESDLIECLYRGASSLFAYGDLIGAETKYNKALAISETSYANIKICCLLAGRAHVFHSRGLILEALTDFLAADLIDKKQGSNSDHRPCGHNLEWVQILLTAKQPKAAREKLDPILEFSARGNSRTLQEICQMASSDCDLALGNVDAAVLTLTSLASSLSHNEMPPALLLSLNEALLEKGDWEKALYYAEQALSYAQTYQRRLLQVSALVAVGKARLLSKSLSYIHLALSNAEQGLGLARNLGYRLGEYSALKLARDCTQSLALQNTDDVVNYKKQALEYSQEIVTLEGSFLLTRTQLKSALAKAKQYVQGLESGSDPSLRR
jgi:tetratricopeptide (TPR) repeat protein